MSNVIAFRRSKANDKAGQYPAAGFSDGEIDGSMLFTSRVSGRSEMKITGVFERRLQFGAFTLIKALSELVDKMADNGTVGHTSVGPIHEPLPGRPEARRGQPKRLRESTGFGGL